MTIEKRKEIQELQKLNTELDHIAKYLIEAFITAGSNKVELPEKWVADTLLLRTRERIEEEAPEMPAVEEFEEDTGNISEDRQEEFFKTFEHFVSIQKISEIRKRHYNVIIRALKKMIKLAGIDRMVTTLNTVTREEEKHPIWEVASSHMARRVLVGNLYKEVKDPNLIAKISGHVENSRAFSRYRDIDEEMAKETIMKLE